MITLEKISQFQLSPRHSILPVDAHSVDIISIVLNEIPLDIGATYQQSQLVSKVITDKVFFIEKLEPLAFITSGSKVASISGVTDLKLRHENIVYFRFCCTMDGIFVDKRVTDRMSLSFQFYLKLTHHIYDIRGVLILA